MKRFAFLWMVVHSALAFGPALAGDAATEAQEGHIDHWIEYYQKERGGTVVTKQPKDEQRSNGESGGETGDEDPVTPQETDTK